MIVYAHFLDIYLLAFVVGDFNIDVLKENSFSSTEFCTYVGSYGFTPLINKITRPGTPGSCIDNILARNHEETLNQLTGVINHLCPDHRPIFTAITGFPEHGRLLSENPTQRAFFRYFSQHCHTNFQDALYEVNWDEILISDNAQRNFTAFINKVESLYDNKFPLGVTDPKRRVRQVTDPWYDKELIQLRSYKDRIANKVKKFNLAGDKCRLKEVSKFYRQKVKAKKQAYYNVNHRHGCLS